MRVIKSKSRLTCIAINCLADDKSRKTVDDKKEEVKSSEESSQIDEQDQEDEEFGENELDEDEFGESDLEDEYSSHDEEQIKKNNRELMNQIQSETKNKKPKTK